LNCIKQLTFYLSYCTPEEKRSLSIPETGNEKRNGKRKLKNAEGEYRKKESGRLRREEWGRQESKKSSEVFV
jgi:hypothetical protein